MGSSAVPVPWGAMSLPWSLTTPCPFLERVELEAIQTAKPTQAPMPTSQANMPSLTGPNEPRLLPPYFGASSTLLR